MKKYIYLEPDESITSVIKKIKASKIGEINLVIPANSLIFNDKDLTALKSTYQGKKIITLYSNDEKGLALAKKVGLQIADDNAMSPTSSEQNIKIKNNNPIKIVYKKKNESLTKKKSIPKPDSEADEEKNNISIVKQPSNQRPAPNLFNKVLFGSLSVISIIIIIFVVLLVVPTTNITITTQAKSIPFAAIVTLDSKQKSPDIINNILPAQVINLEEQISQEARATGSTNNGTKASGIITVYNKTSSPLPLMGGTRFVNKDNILFRSQGSVNINPNSSSDVTVEADIIGTKGNIGPSSFTLPALPGSESIIFGESKQSMSGGSDQISYNITNDDLKFSTDEIRKKLYEKALSDLKNKLPKDKNYISPSIESIQVNATPDHVEGDQVEIFNIIAKANIPFMVYDKNQLKELMDSNLSRNLSKDRVFVNDEIDSFNIKIETADFNNTTAKIGVSTNAINIPIYNEEMIKSNISGKTSEEVKSYFLNYPEIQHIDINFWPDWSKRVSKIPSRVSLKIIWQ